MRRLAACCWLLLALVTNGHAQAGGGDTSPAGVSAERSDNRPLTLHFHLDRTDIDTSYMDNAHGLARLNGLLADSALAARIDSVGILSFASPDGRQTYNRILASHRSISIRDYLLRHYPHLDAARIRLSPQGENWQGLRRLIAADDSLPGRDAALRVIDRTPDDERREALLKQLDGGRTYRHIARHILPQLRNASVCVVYLRPPLPAISTGEIKGAAIPPVIARADSLLYHDGHTTGAGTSGGMLPPYPQGSPAVAPYHHRLPLLAVKTNLLFDLAMAPNIEIEVPLGKRGRWSVNAEWMFPWWLFKSDKYCFQVLSGGVEGRYWTGDRSKRRALTGHFVGFYAGGGKYDLQWDRDGYQGEFYIASGVSYGYACPIGRNLSLEFSIGVGLLRTSYEHYHTLDNYQTLLWQNNGRYTWLGPTKAKISLVWLLSRKTKKGGAR